MSIDLHTNERKKLIKRISKGKISKKRLQIARTVELVGLLDDSDWQEIKDSLK